ncbi:uncharacterized protein LOC107472386 [Arachis duranensis]|uniref:Uncharacterized protein LOC107472386 n=1 Tax=Arachis duranensis TaxID=130453 RepID=A0A6P4C884_ARADU|nr:uncharacterized protein LOC107472386 [Arachis duranensis]
MTTSKDVPEKLKEKDNQPHSSKEEVQGQQQVEKSITPPLPYPQRFHKEAKDQHFHKFLETLKKLEINIPLAEALEQMPLYARFLKELINKKRSWLEKETVLLTEECSAVLKKGISPKLKYPGSFVVACTIGKMTLDKAFCDLGATQPMVDTLAQKEQLQRYCRVGSIGQLSSKMPESLFTNATNAREQED